MEYRVEDLIREAKIAIDENTENQNLVDTDDTDTLELDDIIRSKVAVAVRVVGNIAPAHLIDNSRSFTDSDIHWLSGMPGYGAGVILLPGDFMRLVSFKMTDWKKPVFNAITEDSPIYLRQISRVPGIKGNPQRPVVAIVHSREGLSLELYSCLAGDSVSIEQADYLPLPSIISEKINISTKLKDAVVYYIAYLTALSLNNEKLATYMLDASKTLMT